MEMFAWNLIWCFKPKYELQSKLLGLHVWIGLEVKNELVESFQPVASAFTAKHTGYARR